MKERIITWQQGQPGLGLAVVAIGVFDGVHFGHQQLLSVAVDEARALSAISVALTFDRDPDQVVSPESAAPQLLTLEDKCEFILDSGIDVVLVVPFTDDVRTMPAEEFLNLILGSCCEVAAIHVGADFRFGAQAAGTVETMRQWAAGSRTQVRAHELVTIDGAAVTSTRIRALVTSGQVEEAAVLLGRPTRLTGMVKRGREEGRKLGFPTANVSPVGFAAVPGDGVYAGRILMADGSVWPAAISVGVPPTFPEARDYVEAHAIGYSGDLYGQIVTLEFVERLRSQKAFGSLTELTEAISADVRRAAFALEGEPPFELNPVVDIGHKVAHRAGMDIDLEEYGESVVDDPAALAAAEREVATREPVVPEQSGDEEWVELLSPRRLSGIFGNAGWTAALVTAPLQAAGIPVAWDPYPPEQMPSFRPYYGVFDRPFSLRVPVDRLKEAQEIIDVAYGYDAATQSERNDATAIPATVHSREVEHAGNAGARTVAWLILILGFLTYLFGRLSSGGR